MIRPQQAHTRPVLVMRMTKKVPLEMINTLAYAWWTEGLDLRMQPLNRVADTMFRLDWKRL